MKTKVVVIGGGETFATYQKYLAFLHSIKLDFSRKQNDWKANLQKDLGNRFEVIRVNMPNKFNAKYEEWKIWFHKYEPLLDNKTILIGHSLGALFLVKYMQENKFTSSVAATILAGTPYGALGFSVPKDFNRFIDKAGKIYLYHSQDDPIVPFGDYLKYMKKLRLTPSVYTGGWYLNGGHFLTKKIPEIINVIKDRHYLKWKIKK